MNHSINTATAAARQNSDVPKRQTRAESEAGAPDTRTRSASARERAPNRSAARAIDSSGAPSGAQIRRRKRRPGAAIGGQGRGEPASTGTERSGEGREDDAGLLKRGAGRGSENGRIASVRRRWRQAGDRRKGAGDVRASAPARAARHPPLSSPPSASEAPPLLSSRRGVLFIRSHARLPSAARGYSALVPVALGAGEAVPGPRRA
jgi:hypothetical protein